MVRKSVFGLWLCWLVTLVIACGAGCGGGSGGGNTGGGGVLKATLDDVYFEDHYMRDVLGPGIDEDPYESWLWVRVTLKNTGDEDVCVDEAYFQDSQGNNYGCGLSIEGPGGSMEFCVDAGETRRDCEALLMFYDIPRDGRGLKLIIDTYETKDITVSLPNTDSIRVEKAAG